MNQGRRKVVYSKSGITLIALIVTVIVLIILAGISLNLILGENGIIRKSKEAKENYTISANEEHTQIDRLTNIIDDTIQDGTTTPGGDDKPEEPDEPVSPEGTINFSEVSWNSTTHEASVNLSKANNVASSLQIQYQINSNTGTWKTGTTVEGLKHGDVVYVRLWNGETGGKNTQKEIKDVTPPTVTLNVTTTGSKSLLANIQATDEQYGMPENPIYHFYIKKTSEADSEYKLEQSNASTRCEFTDLDQTTSYTIKVTTTDKAGNEGVSIQTEITGTVEIGYGNIILGAPIWDGSTHTAKVSITKGETVEDSLQIQYKKNGDPTNLTEGWILGTEVNELQHNDIVYARLWDGKNAGSNTSLTIKDTIEPQDATVNWINGNSTTEKVTLEVEVTLTDNESGVDITNSKWSLTDSTELIGTDGIYENKFSNTDNNTTQSIKVKNDTMGTYYLHILTEDIAGNRKETVIEQPVSVNKKVQISEVTAGSYVEYDTGKTTLGNEGKVLCRVLYPATSEYGFQLITDECAESLSIYGKDGYNSFLSDLNSKAYNYLNEEFALDTRSVGCSPVNVNGKFTNKILSGGADTYGFQAGDEAYVKDQEALESSGCGDAGDSRNYWIASRLRTPYSNGTAARTRYYKNGTGITWDQPATTQGGWRQSTCTRYVRSCILLKPHVIITGGNGSKENPYTLGLSELVVQVNLDRTSATIVVGNTREIKASVIPEDALNTNIVWSSSNENIATVEDGVITAKAVGEVTITATAADGSGKSADCTVTVVDSIEVTSITGEDYLEYDTGDVTLGENGKIICTTLYPINSEYGWQIISSRSVEKVKLGTVNEGFAYDWEDGKLAYNSAITTLNKAAEKYINIDYASDARCVGSNPGNKNAEGAGYVSIASKFYKSSDKTVKNEDTNYTTDIARMRELGIIDCGDTYWLASRKVNYNSTNAGTSDTMMFKIRLASKVSTGNVRSRTSTYRIILRKWI